MTSQTTIRHNAKFGVEDLTVAIGGRCDDRVQKSFDRQSDTLIRYVCFESIAIRIIGLGRVDVLGP